MEIEEKKNPLQELGNKHGIRGAQTLYAIAMIERAVYACPEDVVTEDEVTAAMATQLAKRIGHHGGEAMAMEFLAASLKEIRDYKATVQS